MDAILPETMTKPEFVAALLQPQAYSHSCADIRLVETHISWVFLTGDFAYKVKKPVAFNFVDFSTAELRTHYCAEEVRCNRPFSEALYLGVVTINCDKEGHYHVDGNGPVVESAVKMREFPGAQQLDRLLAAGGLEVGAMRRFGENLADQHSRLPRLDCGDVDVDEVDTRVRKPALDNFRALAPLLAARVHEVLLSRIEKDTRTAYERLRQRFVQRLRQGFTRECHGDLHLRNLVLLNERIQAFDCLEFNANLRWIDTVSDVAFLLMDCSVSGRDDLGYAFLDGYLTRSADYEGAALSVFFSVYRSMVRAKVAALQLQELGTSDDRELVQRLQSHLEWANARLHRAPGLLLLMCGLSGSGKSYIAERLVPRLPAVRVRSDILRKARAGIASDHRSNSPVDGGLYTKGRSQAVYAEILRVSEELLREGETVLVDATFLDRRWRSAFQSAAGKLGTDCLIVYCRASQATLEDRVRTREQEGDVVSEAGIEVLRRQQSRFDPISRNEPYIELDTEAAVDVADLASRIRAAVS